MIQDDVSNSKYKPAFWSEWSSMIISDLNLKQTAKGEWHGACPHCGGVDRFWITELAGEIKVHCRQCNDFKAITDALRYRSLWPQIDERVEYKPKSTPIEWPDPEPNTHPYLAKKRVQQHNAVVSDGNLCVPIIDATGKRVGIQTIDADGKKRFSAGMATKSNFSVIGGPIVDQCYVAEGWATAASVYEASGVPCVFALSANNMCDVIGALKLAKPFAKITIAGDNDDAGHKAVEACKATHDVEAYFPPAGMDFNDLWVAQGKDAVVRFLTTVQAPADASGVIRDLKIETSDDFLSDLEPLEYLVDGLLPKGVTYSLTGHAGHGKTTLALQFALSVARGEMFGHRETSQGSVLILAGENPHNVKWQYAAAIAARGLKASDIPNIHFVQGRFSINEMSDVFRAKIDQIKDLKLVIIDSLQAFFEGDNDNDNSQMVEMAHKLRDLCDVPSRPAALIIAHPAGKVASKDNLVPRGGGAFLNEIDGNLTVWSQDATQQTLHHSQKFRGAGFDPMEWVMQIHEFQHLTDIHGTPLKLPVSRPELLTESAKREQDMDRILELFLYTVDADKPMSVRELAAQHGISKWKAEQVIRLAKDEKLIRRHAKKYVLTTGGADFLKDKSA